MPKRFVDQVVIITGASAGIGASAARGFAAEGARVVLAARGREALETVAEEIRAAGGEAIVVPTDVADDDACRALVAAATDTWGRLDVLVNNAGLHHRGGYATHPAEKLADMVTVNLRAPVFLTRLAIDPMRDSGGGTIVNVASIAGYVPLPEAAVYSATKFGLRALSRALFEELSGDGIRVTAVSPGPVATGFILSELDTVSPLALSQPMSTADEVAEDILDCAADGRIERARPRISAALATVSYLFPVVGRTVRPLLRKKGERTKRKLQREGS